MEDSAVKAPTSNEAPATSLHSELQPSGNLQYNYDTIEQHFACDLPDGKDTRSKECTSEVVEQSIHETIGKEVTRFQKAKAPVPEEVEDETSIRQEEYVSTPRTHTGGELSRSLSIPPADTESLSTGEGIQSRGKTEILDTPRRSTRRVPRAKPEKMDPCEQTPAQSHEEFTTPRTTVSTGRRGRKKRSILEESIGEEAFPQGPGGSPLLLEGVNPPGQGETSRTWRDGIRRTRSRTTALRQKLPVEENESFLFSPPIAKLTKKDQAVEADHPVQLMDLDPDLSSQFVFSPPLLRSRKKTTSPSSRIVKEQELLTKEDEEAKSMESVGKQQLKRGRTAKSKTKKASKATGEEGSWSPPSVEIKFISPFGSPVDGPKGKQKEIADVAEKTLRKSRKRLSNFPKPVVRRKML